MKHLSEKFRLEFTVIDSGTKASVDPNRWFMGREGEICIKHRRLPLSPPSSRAHHYHRSVITTTVIVVVVVVTPSTSKQTNKQTFYFNDTLKWIDAVFIFDSAFYNDAFYCIRFDRERPNKRKRTTLITKSENYQLFLVRRFTFIARCLFFFFARAKT